MIEQNMKYASVDDIIVANELFYSDKEFKKLRALILNSLPIINLGCVCDKDNVLIVSENQDILHYIISFIYMPNKLAVNYCCNDVDYEEIWPKMVNILDGYVNTKPDFKYFKTSEAKYDRNSYDVIYTHLDIPNRLERVNEINRFLLDSGEKYKVYCELLVQLAESLKIDGRLVLYTKPSWILKTWELVHELGLEIEYHGRNYYEHSYRNPNANVWLRFTKKGNQIDIDSQKRNILSLMKDNYIDRLFAHRNNLRFPYVEVSYKNSDTFISCDQNYNNMQYFFSLSTTKKLAELCENYTACLVTPSIAKYAHSVNKEVVLFECDNRFRENKGVKFVKYDLNKGLTVVNKSKYANKYHTVISDPPFNVNLDYLARDILELVVKDVDSNVYIVFPDSRKQSLINAMKKKGFCNEIIEEEIVIEYAKPPKIVRINGKKAIRLHKFILLTQS